MDVRCKVSFVCQFSSSLPFFYTGQASKNVQILTQDYVLFSHSFHVRFIVIFYTRQWRVSMYITVTEETQSQAGYIPYRIHTTTTHSTDLQALGAEQLIILFPSSGQPAWSGVMCCWLGWGLLGWLYPWEECWHQYLNCQNIHIKYRLTANVFRD